MEETELKPVSKPAGRKGPVRIKLQEPIEWGSEVIKEIVLQPIKAKHMKLLGKDVTAKDLLLIASKISGQPSAVIDELSSQDALQVIDAVGELL